MPKILQLVMIVKDSEDTILRTLQAIKPYIDHWTILDTGSRDKTMEIIQREMKDKPGKLYEEPFIDFSTSRNRALELAGTICKYTIMLDDSYIVNGGKNLYSLLKRGKENSYDIAILDNRNRIYYSKRILRADKKLRYKYRVHEVVQDCSGCILNYFTTKIYIYDNRDWKSDYRSKQRIPYYLSILNQDHKKYPKDNRIIYNLANTYFSAEEYDKSIEFYRKRISNAGIDFNEEVYLSQYMIACCLERQKVSTDIVIDTYRKAFDYDNYRAEPLYQIAVIYYRQNDLENAYLYLQKAYSIKIPQSRYLQVEYRTYFEEIPTLFADVCLKLGKKEKGKNIIEKTLKNIPNSIRLKNMKSTFLEDTVTVIKCSVPVIVFHSGYSWDPETMENTSGSEIMTKEIAEELVRRKYRVIVFVNNLKNKVLNKVEYKDSTEYINFLEKFYVDVLFVSRFVDNLIYKEGTQKVYLWLHDVLPQGNSFQTHKIKFKGVLCLCNWHKNFFCKEFNFPEEMVIVTRNGIKPERFAYKIEKQKLRFIYTSDPKRGLKNVLDMWDSIKKRYPIATLYIFSDDIPGDLVSEIRKKKGILVQERLNQDEIAREFLKSDVWLYPTEWRETYCITALEAQASRTLCAAFSKGSLPEIIGDRGILALSKEELLKKLFFTLENDVVKDILLNKAEKWAKEQNIVNLVTEWEKNLL